MLKIKQENEKLNAMILKKAMKSNNMQARHDNQAYAQEMNIQQQIGYQPVAYQCPNMGHVAHGQDPYGMPYALLNPYDGQQEMGFDINAMAQNNGYMPQANNYMYNHNQRGPQ